MSNPGLAHLRGITWNHTRGHLPMVATAQRFCELHPQVTIQWEVRSLQAFADAPIEVLAKQYDLLVVDHPSTGRAARVGALLPLDEYIPASFLADQASNSVGRSHASYRYEGHQYALAIDAAAPISGWRPDLLEKARTKSPETWPELLDLARQGLVILPGIAIDSLMNFYMLCGALGEGPFQHTGKVVSEGIGAEALLRLRQLLLLCEPECFTRNPIATWQALSTSDTVAYCPFAYGYSNYSRKGYARYPLQTGDLVTLENNATLKSTLGGAGLAISTGCQHKDMAARYAQMVASPECQSTLYLDSGGQPGHRSAWLDAETNRRCNNFFVNTLPTLDAAYVRPRFDGYLDFQVQAGRIVHRYLTDGGKEGIAIEALDRLLTATMHAEQRAS